MAPFTKIFLALGIAGLAAADSYANFFDDRSCSENGGIGVNLENSGCLNQAGRGSVYIPNDGHANRDHYMCTYTENDCGGSAAGNPWQFTATGFCQTLETAGAISYRFVRDANAC